MRAQEIDEMRGLEISFCGSWGRGRPRAGGGVVVDCNPMAHETAQASTSPRPRHGSMEGADPSFQPARYALPLCATP